MAGSAVSGEGRVFQGRVGLTVVALLLGGGLRLLRHHEVVLLLLERGLLLGSLLLSGGLGLSLCLRLRLLLCRLLLGLDGRARLAGPGSDARRQGEARRARAHARAEGGGGDGPRGKVGVGEGVDGRVSAVGLKLQQVLEEGDGVARCLGHDRVQRLLGVLGEGLLERDLGRVHLDLLQRCIRGRADDLHDLDELVVVVTAAE
jgi:hypothetical protein